MEAAPAATSSTTATKLGPRTLSLPRPGVTNRGQRCGRYERHAAVDHGARARMGGTRPCRSSTFWRLHQRPRREVRRAPSPWQWRLIGARQGAKARSAPERCCPRAWGEGLGRAPGPSAWAKRTGQALEPECRGQSAGPECRGQRARRRCQRVAFPWRQRCDGGSAGRQCESRGSRDDRAFGRSLPGA